MENILEIIAGLRSELAAPNEPDALVGIVARSLPQLFEQLMVVQAMVDEVKRKVDEVLEA
jgi:hypothetical protein